MELKTKLSEQWGDALQVRDATPSEAIDGVQPQLVAAPANEEAAHELVAWCGRENLAFVPRGGGSKLHIGAAPQRCDLIISTENLNQIIEHDEGNATVCAGAGITLRELNRVVGQHNQFVPIEDEAQSTLGGIVATNYYSASRLKYTTPRDLVVGLNASLTDGRFVKAGSKVVKNVSGYDLMKIFTGSYGTLGLLTQVTIRLRPQNEASRTWQSTFLTLDDAVAAASTIHQGDFEPSTLRITAAKNTFIVESRFDGSIASLETQWQRLPQSWEIPTAAEVVPDVEVRAILPIQSTLQWVQAAQAAGANQIFWDYGFGEVRVLWSAAKESSQVEQLRSAAEIMGGFLILERAPAEWKTPELVWGNKRSDWPLMQRLKDSYDAARVCSPGRFVGGL